MNKFVPNPNKHMDTIAVVDFGGQYAHLIANRTRRLGVYSKIVLPEDDISEYDDVVGIILSGGPQSVYDDESPTLSKEILLLGKPILGICYGHQLMHHLLGGYVAASSTREYGLANMDVVKKSKLFEGIEEKQEVWMSHGDYVDTPAEGFEIIGSTEDCETAAVADEKRQLYGLQFHPEVTHSANGMKMLENFLFSVCGAKKSWDMNQVYEEIKEEVVKDVGDKNVFVLVSGGVDSSVLFLLLNNALGEDRVKGFLIDHGMMRLHEADEVQKAMKEAGFTNLECVHAEEVFLSALKGIADPEEKRKIIGRVFLHITEKIMMETNLDSNKWLLAQGTIYPDTIETGGTKHADTIKTHHNRVQEIEEMIEQGLVIEPLKQLYKDEVRELGAIMGLPGELLNRHPFPGPGLGIRTLCVDINNENLGEGVEEIEDGVLKLPVESVGVQGDGRTYAHPAILTHIMDYDEMEKRSTKLTNTYKELNRVLWRVAHTHNWNKFHLKAAYLTEARIGVLQRVDAYVKKRLQDTGWYDSVWQCPIVLVPFGDLQESIVLRPIDSKEAMTARFSRIEQGLVVQLAEEIVEKFPIEAVFYDVTNKPPGTIEWE